MRKKLSLAVTIALVVVGLTSSLPQFAFAACGRATDSKGQVLQGIGETGGDCSGTDVNNTIQAAVEILSIVVGIAAVIVIIVSGLKYITSGGDSGKVSSAKSTLVYALVGLAIAALAQFLVHFVLTQADNSSKLCKGHTYSQADPRCK